MNCHQVALNAHQWLDQPERWNRIKLVVRCFTSSVILVDLLQLVCFCCFHIQ